MGMHPDHPAGSLTHPTGPQPDTKASDPTPPSETLSLRDVTALAMAAILDATSP